MPVNENALELGRSPGQETCPVEEGLEIIVMGRSMTGK